MTRMLRRIKHYLIYALLCIQCCLISPGIQAASSLAAINIGYKDTFKVSDAYLTYKGYMYPLYEFLEIVYIPLPYLIHMGAVVEETETTLYLNTVTTPSTQPIEAIGTPEPYIYMNPKQLMIKQLMVETLVCNDIVYVPVHFLSGLWQMTVKDPLYLITDRLYEDAQYVTITDQSIINQTDYLLRMQMLVVLWDGSNTEDYQQTVVLEPHEHILKESLLYDKKEDQRALGWFVQEINGVPTDIPPEMIEGYHQTNVLAAYEEASKHYQSLVKVFRPTAIQAKMRYGTGKLQANDIVRILWAERNNYYVVHDSAAKEHLIPWNSLEIIGKDWYASSQATNEQIALFANLSSLTSDTPYLIWTDIARQRTYVLKWDINQWHVEKHFICATGKDRNPTPTGFFRLQYAIPYFGTDHGYRCKNALVFFRDYMYHSVLFDKTGKYIKKGQLGTQASSGCVRLSEADSAWLYKNVPIDTKVWIQ